MPYDVVVVGAGPGGSTAAYWLARAGADVLLIDKAKFPRNKPCGDGLTPRAVAMLQAMNLDDSLLDEARAFTGVRFLGHDNQPSFFDLHPGNGGEPRHGLVIPRRNLDDAIRLQAMAAGARFLSGVNIVKPHYCQKKLARLQGRCNGREITIEAKLFIIATGASRTLLQLLGMVKEEQPKALALRAYVDNLPVLDEYLEIYLDRELLPGYAWVFPVGKGIANVGVGIKLDGLTTVEGSRQLRTAFHRLLTNERLNGGRLLGSPQGYPLRTDFPAIPTHAENVLVVGEAAGLVDPLTGEGIALALESGQLAAEVANNALTSGNISSGELKRYDEVLRERHAGYFEDTRELMARLADLTVLEAVIQCSRKDERVRKALSTAIVDEQPRNGIMLLGQALQSNHASLLASALFTLNAYQPLLHRCRTYMLAQVSLDTPSPLILNIVSRGKMLRALLVFLGCQAAKGDPEQVLAAAAGIELVHTASLIHDDIMDNGHTRRGLPALHKELGISRAIVCGDYLIAKAFRLLAESHTTRPAAQVVDAFIVGAQSGIRSCMGQFQDVAKWSEELLNEKSYHELIAGKTASVIAGALAAGAALAGGERTLLESLSRYGEYVGRAFQIRDDILELGTLSQNGCYIDRRISLPLIHAFQQNGSETGQALIRKFLDNEEVASAQISDLLRMTRSLTYAQAVADSLVEEAIRLVDAFTPVEEVLKAFAHYVVIREH